MVEEDAAASSSGSAAPNNVGGGGGGGGGTTAANDNHRNSIQQSRPDYLTSLLSGRTPSLRLESSQDDNDTNDELQKATSNIDGSSTTTTPPRRPSRAELSKRLTSMRNSMKKLHQQQQQQSIIENVEVKLHNYSYHVPIRIDAPSIKTVFNQSPCYVVTNFMMNVGELITGVRKVKDVLGYYEKKWILQDINLVLKPGMTYLVMGPPSCGKTSLLQGVAGMLKKEREGGMIEYNGVSREDEPDMILQNVVSYVGQLDNHAAFLTVQETFDFAADCRIGKKKRDNNNNNDDDNGDDEEDNNTNADLSENLTIDGLDLAVCRNTYVGDANNRGVSGGQRRRVTLGEMMVGQNPVACADEISTGLDAAVTYEISSSIVNFAKAAGTTRLVSLLQPGPETFSLFDEVILLAEGRLIYAGPINEVVDYFASLGYEQPNTMDVADFLQSVATPDGAAMFHAEKSPMDEHYSAADFAKAFQNSPRHNTIVNELSSSTGGRWRSNNLTQLDNIDEENPTAGGGGGSGKDVDSKAFPEEIKDKYKNSFFASTSLIVARNLTLLKRNKEFLIGKTIENFGMGIGMALIFLQSAAFPSNVNGSQQLADYILQGCPDNKFNGELSRAIFKLLAGTYSSIFLGCFHILLGTLTGTPDEVDARSIYYKHADARFFQAGAFLLGGQLSQLPLLFMEIVAFGLPFYFIAGLAYTARAFFIYLAILIVYKFSLKMLYGVLVQTLPKKANVQGVGTFLYLLITLTSGFIVYPSVIPSYWKWLFYLNPMAWAMQGMASNQFLSSKYSGYVCDLNGTEFNLGVQALQIRGWEDSGREWIAYTFAFLVPYTIVFGLVTLLALKYVRIEPDRQHVKKKVNIGAEKKSTTEEINVPFIPVDLSFDKLTYEVTASTSKEQLRLLNEVSGVFKAGRMCALMGSSGAGKTTLMDVIAMRKTSGTITGAIELNGHEQERTSFLRSSGYVEQFDVQSSELTVRETVEFSGRLRLDANEPAIGDDETKMKFVDHVLEIMELTDIATLQVGSFEEGGLTFEQRKRLAIACELVGSPSVIFLDEPTSGLDSRGALVVIRAMRRIADSGRTVVATIHQPSAAVFEMFDDLILLKKGGNVVFFGELGEESNKLVSYFEERGAAPIAKQENPAAWVLRAYAGEHSSSVDWGELYKSSNEAAKMEAQIVSCRESSDSSNKISFSSTYSTPIRERMRLMCARMMTIYRRSAPYNMTRMVVSILYAFLLGSVFIKTSYERANKFWTESDAAALIGTVFLSLNVVGTTAMTMAIPVAKKARDVFYKHRASGMIEHNSMFLGLVTAELPYLLALSLLFVLIYCATTGLLTTAASFFWFVLFFFLHTASYSYFAQCFMCLVRDEKTVGALQGVWIGLNLFYAGFVVLPQNFFSFFWLGLWINASRYALEGIIFSQFEAIPIEVTATPDSPYWYSLGCSDDGTTCSASLLEFAYYFFGEKFSASQRGIDIGVLVGWNVLALFGIWLCLKKFNYVNT